MRGLFAGIDRAVMAIAVGDPAGTASAGLALAPGGGTLNRSQGVARPSELPGLMERCAPVDMFYHDGLHTYEHMVREFGTTLPQLGIGGLLASDDVLSPTDVQRIFPAGPFHSFCGERRIPFQTLQNLGLAWPERAGAARERAA